MSENENPIPSPTAFNLTFFEACEILSKSKKSVSRYIRRGLLHPQKTKSQQGTLEYRFSRTDLEDFKQLLISDETRPDQTTQDRTDTPYETRHQVIIREKEDETGRDKAGQTTQDETDETGKNEMVNFLKEQIKVKDGQIAQLMERDREVNVILKSLHDKIFTLEAPKKNNNNNQENNEQ